MANAQRIAAGIPFPAYVNETATKQRISPGVYVDETIASASPPAFFPQRNKIVLEGENL